MALLYAVHDQSGHALVPAGGWCVESIAIAENPQPQNWTQIRPDINWILRLNWAHNGKDGTIPLRGQYDEFAKRCADYMAHTGGVQVVIIANEPNHAQEYPHGVPIAPEDYADCFNGCYRTITYERPDCEVMAAAVAPWDVTSGIDWLAYYKRMLAPISECDGLAVHGYTHGADPNLIWSSEKVQGWYWHFPVIYQTIQAIPPRFATRPVHVTETDQGDNAWVDANSGWVQNAYQSVDDHNRTPGTQKIYSLALYRWRGDKYEIHNKPQVQEDFKAAVKRGYISPGEPMPTPPQPQPPRPQPPQPPTPEPPTPAPEPARDIDPRLIARGVEFDFVTPPAGTGYWRITKAQWLDHAASQVGPDHHILGRVLKDNVETPGVTLRVWWPSGTTTVTSKRDDPNATYNYDYGMGPSLKEYTIQVSDGNASDQASGIGMGKDGNPREHTSTWLNFEWTISEGVTAPIPPTPIQGGDLVHPLPGAVIIQHWGQNEADYRQFGLWGHNGCDLGNRPQRTPIRSIADGIVAYSDFDAAYGHYVRADYRDLDCYAMYCHLDEPGAPVGTRLNAGDTVGLLGTSGNSTGVHLHLEIRLQNKDGTYREDTPMPKGRVDPETWAAMHNLKL
jgi:murein DD-endopeptidase MepM/ murein hydrolase activator NlpD